MTTELARIQRELKAPKGQKNDFGGYRYRSCEDILEAVKPLLDGLVLTLSDELVNIGNRYYVKATARLSQQITITDPFKIVENAIEVTAYAREQESRKGMDESQITGSASSYARKYALNGLFLIDDTKDADTMDNRDTRKEISDTEEKKIDTWISQDLAAEMPGVYETLKTVMRSGKLSLDGARSLVKRVNYSMDALVAELAKVNK